MNALRRLYRALQPPGSNYSKPIGWKHLLPPKPTIYDIGGKDQRHAVKDATYYCVDIMPGPGVDIVADAHDMHVIPDNSVDMVMSISVLEHVRYPEKVVAEMYRILKPGGLIYINVPFIFPFHSDPDDFRRWTSDGILILCENFERIASGWNRGPASTMHELLVKFAALLFSFNSQRLYGVMLDVFGWAFFWVKYMDVWMAKHPNAKVLHAGTYFLGRKPR
jgi:SAM-dependent methyltransferase